MKYRIAPVAAVTTVLLLCSSGWAASPTEQLRGLFAAATRILDDPDQERKPEERLSAIRTIVGEMFDFREAAQLSLGPEWSARTAAERTEFVQLFTDLLERSFIGGIVSRIRLADGVQVSYLGESIDGALATVRTAILSKSGFDLPFHYRMIERSDGWAVRDVVVDGVSLAANYRAQFIRVIQASSYGDLVRHMRARVSGPSAASALTVTTVEDGRPIEPVRPESLLGPARTEASTTTPPDLRADEAATATRAAAGPPPTATPIAFVTIELVATRPKLVITSGPAMDEPDQVASAPAPRSQARLQLESVVTPRPLSAQPSSAMTYWVQVGAFANPEMARRLASLLRKQEPPVSPDRWVVTEAVAAGPPLARVRMGPFPIRAEAVSRLRELQARGYQPFIAEERD